MKYIVVLILLISPCSNAKDTCFNEEQYEFFVSNIETLLTPRLSVDSNYQSLLIYTAIRKRLEPDSQQDLFDMIDNFSNTRLFELSLGLKKIDKQTYLKDYKDKLNTLIKAIVESRNQVPTTLHRNNIDLEKLKKAVKYLE